MCIPCSVYIFTIRDKKKKYARGKKSVPVILLFFTGYLSAIADLCVCVYIRTLQYAVVRAGADQPGNASGLKGFQKYCDEMCSA